MMRIVTIFILSIAISSCNTDSKTEVKSKAVNTTLTTGGEKDESGATRITVGATSITKNVNKEEFVELMAEKSGTILDVRTPKEFNAGNIEGSVNHNILANTFTANVRNLDKNKPVYVYCKSGARSARAMGELQKIGFKEIYNFTEGYDGWK